ncbi:MAG TPA: class I SAM-dependent methyltransferase [Polyangiaceae bacterium]|jgi:SAM-dependent methyltransferase|nr:class I SAM-dependent methyltransferase [Polyangiaceae bacterium]
MIEQWRSRRYADIASYTHSGLPPWFQEFAQSLLRDSMIDLVEALTIDRQPFARIIDLGCGVGDWTVEWARLGHSVVGVDVSQSFLDEAARRGYASSRVRFELGDLREHADFRAGDFVCYGSCLAFVDDAELEKLFERMATAQAPRDFVYVRVNCRHGDRPRHATEDAKYRAVAEYLALFLRHGYELRFMETSLGVVLVRRLLITLNAAALSRVHRWFARPLRAARTLLVEGDHYNFLLEKT